MDNLYPLEGAAINPYLKKLGRALEALCRALHEQGEEDVSDYCRQIIDTLAFFRYSREGQKEGIDPRLRLDPSVSGFPNNVEFIRLFQEKSRAEKVLAELPGQEELARSAMGKILEGEFPEAEQQSKLRLDYYRRLRDYPIVQEYEVVRVRQLEENGDGRRYHLHWRGLDQTKNLFVAYNLDLVQDLKDEPLCRRPGSDGLFTLLMNKFGLGAGHLLKSVDTLPAVHPKAARRYVIGPYYCELTKNSTEVAELFERVSDPFILRYRCERVVSEKTLEIKKSIFRKPDQMELCSDEQVENFAYCPNRLRQELGELFLAGGEEDYRVVGITEEGLLVD